MEHPALTGPIRDFVPVLVYKGALDRWSDLRAGAAPAASRAAREDAGAGGTDRLGSTHAATIEGTGRAAGRSPGSTHELPA